MKKKDVVMKASFGRRKNRRCMKNVHLLILNIFEILKNNEFVEGDLIQENF